MAASQRHPDLLAAGGGNEGSSLRVLLQAWPCKHFDLDFLASRAETECILVVPSRGLCDVSQQSPGNSPPGRPDMGT